MTITFESEPAGRLGLRRGCFEVGGRTLETPHFFPVVNIITGPPPLLANGGIWKWFKRLTLRDARAPPGLPEARYHELEGFLTQILHFVDYHISDRMLRDWLPLDHPDEKKTIPQRISSALDESENSGWARKTEPFIFLDSGGYKLLSSQRINLDKYGFTARPRDILRLQLAFGGDLFASLDYPVGPHATDAVARYRKSQENGIEALQLLRDAEVDDKLLYLAVHGRNRLEMRDYTRKLLRRVVEEGLTDRPFGLALGSLVPHNANPRMLIDIVRGAIDELYAHDGEGGLDVSRVPVHAFGVNSTVAPFLTLLGVDTYDGSSFAQAAQNLTYYKPGEYTPQKFLELTELRCSCRACTLIQRGVWEDAGQNLADFPQEGLGGAQSILGKELVRHSGDTVKSRDPSRRYYRWLDGYADFAVIPAQNRGAVSDDWEPYGVPRSYFYALIALHNAETNFAAARALRRATVSPESLNEVLRQATSGPKVQRLLQELSKKYPELSDDMKQLGFANLSTIRPPHRTSRRQGVVATTTPQPRQAKLRVGRPKPADESHGGVDLTLGPKDFDVSETEYVMPQVPVLLLLPCSKKKPYSTSTSHRLVRKHLDAAGIPTEAYEKVSISGNYGPVPQRFEQAPNVMAYDYLLHHTNVERIQLIGERVRRFLQRWEGNYSHVVAYATARPYRRALSQALQGRRNASLLPAPLSRHTATEFRSLNNIRRLVAEMRIHINEE